MSGALNISSGICWETCNNSPLMEQTVESIVRLSLGLIIVTFPLVLPILFSFLFTGNEGEGISNETMWVQERQANLARDRSASRTLPVHCDLLGTLPTNPSFFASSCYLQIIGPALGASNDLQHYTYTVTRSESYVVYA